MPLSFAARHGLRLAALLVTIGVCLCAAQEKALEMRIRLKSMAFDPLTAPFRDDIARARFSGPGCGASPQIASI